MLGPTVSRDPEAIQSAATRSIEIKADIVSRDEREQGDRVYLIYGHTFAHAIELVQGSPRTIKVKRSRSG